MVSEALCCRDEYRGVIKNRRRRWVGLIVAIVSPGPHSSYIVKSLQGELRRRGIEHTVLVPQRCRALISNGDVCVFDEVGRLIRPDVVINGLARMPGSELVECFEVTGVPVINTVPATRRADMKFLTALHLGMAGINHPPTAFAYERFPARSQVIANELGEPVIFKPVDGALGKGVQRFETAEESLRFIRKHRPERYLLQAYAAHPGFGKRMVVVGGNVVGGTTTGIPKLVRKGEPKRGRYEPLNPTPGEIDFALAMVSAVGLDFASIDYFETSSESSLERVAIEINAWPNCIDIDSLCETSVAAHIVDWAVAKAVHSNG